MSENTKDIEDRLGAPGAGLPKIELWVARFRFAGACRNLDRKKAAQLISTERSSLLKIVKSNAPEDCARRVLIKRPRGLEDSSRYWSVFMTLDHLRIVNLAIAEAMVELSAGRTPGYEASTAAVKPRPDIGEEVVTEFDQSCQALAEAGKGLKVTATRFPHPWFGPLDAHSWHVLAGFHMRLHHGQIDRILEGIDS